jgi:hypothetical protein
MTTILASSTFPSISYFQAIASARDGVIIDVYEHFVKQSYRNRFAILAPNGIQHLSIPVQHSRGPQQAVHTMRIGYNTKWQAEHWHSLRTAYNSSPFFEFYADEIRDLLNRKDTKLIDFNAAILDFLLQTLQITTPISYSEAYINSANIICNDRRDLSAKHPSASLQQPYIQVFSDKFDFTYNLSILDLLFNEGPNSASFLWKG